MNTFGRHFRFTTFGESHGVAIGVVIDGIPAGVPIDIALIQAELDKRKPGQSNYTTQRKESDTVQILSGVWQGVSTGSPLAMMIPNEDAHSQDYEQMAKVYRPSHADFTYETKYGIRDYRGGGRSSARETACRVAVGAVAKAMLKHHGIEVHAWVQQVGSIASNCSNEELDFSRIEETPIRCPDIPVALEMMAEIDKVREAGDTIGGIVSFMAKGVPVGLGSPIYGKLQADIGAAMLGINAVKGFQYGSGFESVELRGSELNDVFINADGRTHTRTNHSGGIQGGISNGEDIYGKVAFKPVATIMQSQNTVDSAGNSTVLLAKGRHDACVLPRAVPIVSAMLAVVLIDHLLLNKLSKWQ